MAPDSYSLTSVPPPRDPPRHLGSRKLFGQFVFLILLLLFAGIGALGGLVFVYSSNLPKVRELEDYRPDVMTEIYADDGTAIGTFALEHRVIVTYDQISPILRNAVIAIEDRHFESHWGVDIIGILRAASKDLVKWRKTQGASTLTQQLSKMLFLTPDKSFRRKIQEVLLAIQIERYFTKSQIFTMYANQVDLGHGNFGFEAAAEFFFGKHLNELTLPEAATLAGIPRSPSSYSPLLHPDLARRRRNQVLLAMYETGKINATQLHDATAAPLELNIQRWNYNIAPYFEEEVRQFLERKYGPETVREKGLRVYTSLNIQTQAVAEDALKKGLRNDDKRRGWRGPEKNILKTPLLTADGRPISLETYVDEDWREPPADGDFVHGLVMDVKADFAEVRFGSLTARLTPPDFAWTKKTLAADVFAPGDVDLFLLKEVKGTIAKAALDQEPDVQGAVLVLDNSTGEIKAMVGGYDWTESKYNRAVQAERQVGSSFKVYVYAQAIMDGTSPFDTVVDAPVSYHTSSGIWAPHNYDDKFEGTITVLHALAESRNVPAVRTLARIGVDKVIKLCRKFGITSRLVPNLPLALGASDLTLLEHTSAFTTFPNDGVHIAPRMVTKVTNYDGRLIDDFPAEVSDVIPAATARIMVSILREVFNSGTAISGRAFAAKYPVAGKTGTTNDFTDAWFLGFTPSLTCGVYVGFDDHRTLGNKEEGARVALPIWLDFMGQVLKDKPAEDFAHSPLLKTPDQVKEILASAAPERLLAPASLPSLEPAASKPIPQTTPPGESPEAPRKETATPKPLANPPPAGTPSSPAAKSVAPAADKP
jgi:penicillin-binding protein 1A